MTDAGTEFEWCRSTDNGFARCVWCGIVFGAEDRNDDIRGEEHGPGIGGGVNYTYGPVVTKGGAEYEYVGDSPPSGYLMHRECYKEYHAGKASEENKNLGDFA